MVSSKLQLIVHGTDPSVARQSSRSCGPRRASSSSRAGLRFHQLAGNDRRSRDWPTSPPRGQRETYASEFYDGVLGRVIAWAVRDQNGYPPPSWGRRGRSGHSWLSIPVPKDRAICGSPQKLPVAHFPSPGGAQSGSGLRAKRDSGRLHRSGYRVTGFDVPPSEPTTHFQGVVIQLG